MLTKEVVQVFVKHHYFWKGENPTNFIYLMVFNKTEEVEQILNIKEVPTTLETQQGKVIQSNICNNRP